MTYSQEAFDRWFYYSNNSDSCLLWRDFGFLYAEIFYEPFHQRRRADRAYALTRAFLNGCIKMIGGTTRAIEEAARRRASANSKRGIR